MQIRIRKLADSYHVWFEKPSEHDAEHLEAKKGTLAMALRFLVLNGLRQRRHNIQLLQRQNTQTLDQTLKEKIMIEDLITV